MVSFDNPHFSSGDMLIQAALREDARNNRVPRYRVTPVAGIGSARITDRERLEQNIAAQIVARRAMFDAIIARDEMIASMARQQLNSCSTDAIESSNFLVAHHEQLHASRNGVLLDADQNLDMEDFEDLRAAMHARFDSLTAPSLDDPNEEHRLGPSDCLDRRTA